LAILKAEILAHLNNELNRTETSIDEHILEAMKDLSLQDKFIWIETQVPTIVGRAYYSMPLDYKKLMTIKIDDNKPLEKITWKEYQKAIADKTSADYSEPRCFAIHGGFWYGYPTPDAEYTATLYYNAFVLESEGGTNAVDSIDTYFADIYRNAINCKTKAQYCRSKGMKDTAIAYETDYRQLILPPLKKLIEREPRNVECHDLW